MKSGLRKVWERSLLSLLLVVLMGLGAGCEPIRGGGQTGAAPASPDGGSIVGNGARTVTDARLPGVELVIPREWQVDNSDKDRLVIEGRSSSLAEPPPRVEFQWMDVTTLSPGSSIAAGISPLSMLRSYLTDAFPPSTRWSRSSLVSGHGYRSETIEGGTRTSQFYVVNDVGRILAVRVSGRIGDSSEAIAWSLVRRLLRDREPPRIRNLYFEPREATPDSYVKMVVIAEDEGSGIDVLRLGGASPVPGDDANQPILGFDLPHWRGTVGLWRAYPLSRAFEQTSPNRFEYHFRIPKGAPVGRIVPVSLTVYDQAGNSTQAAAVEARDDRPSRYRSFLRVNGEDRPMPALSVLAPTAEGEAGPDMEPPTLLSLRFEKDRLSPGDASQSLLLTAADATGVAPILGLKLVLVDSSGMRLGACTLDGELKSDDPSLEGYRFPLSLSECLKLHPAAIQVVVNRVRVFDEVGNALECHPGRRDEPGRCDIPDTRFSILK